MQDHEIGTIVRLKSGRPQMTVVENILMVEIGDGRTVRCSWFDGDKVYEGKFPPQAFGKVTEEDAAARKTAKPR